METLGKIVLVLFLSIISAIFGGYVLMVLWKWFVVTIFQLPALTLPSAIGIKLLFSFLTFKTVDDDFAKKDFTTHIARMFAAGICIPMVTLLIGSIIKLFM